MWPKAVQHLSNSDLEAKTKRMVGLGCFVCRFFSAAVRPPAGGSEELYGKANASPSVKLKLEEGNLMALWFFTLLEIGFSLGLGIWIENPNASWMFKLPEWKALVARWPEMKFWVVDYCRYGTAWRKRTKIGSNTRLGGFRNLCTGGHQRVVLKGHSHQRKCLWTLVAQPYPRGVAEAIAAGPLLKSGLLDDDGCFDPAEMAKCCRGRIGEAQNPGPRAPRNAQRLGLLEEVQLVEPQTVVLQDKIWGGFLSGNIGDLLSPGAFRAAMAQPVLLVQFAKEYGNHLYSSGKSLFVFRHLLVFLQQNFVTAKPYIGICWAMVTRWELVEPTIHRIPLPTAIFRAMVTVAIKWEWYRFAGVLCLAFLGIARPGEPLTAR